MNSDFNVALHALVSMDYAGGMLSSEDLAADIRTSSSRVRKVMAQLRRHGLAYSMGGVEGGYRLARDAEGIALDEIAAAVEGRFVYASWHSGDAESGGPVSAGMAEAVDEIYDELEQLCLAHLHDRTLKEFEYRVQDLSNRSRSSDADDAKPEESANADQGSA